MTDYYVLANIKIPMIRKPNGKVESLIDYISIDFEKINELPSKPDYKANYDFIKQKLDLLLRSESAKDAPIPNLQSDSPTYQGSSEPNEPVTDNAEDSEAQSEESNDDTEGPEESPITITLNELSQMQKRKHSKQTSFKNRNVKNFRYTSKSYM